MIFPSIQNLHPKIIIQKQPETRGIPCFRLLFYSCFLFLLFYLCWILSCPALLRPCSGLTPALLRPYFGLPGPYSILTLSLFLDVIPDHTIQIKTQDTKH